MKKSASYNKVSLISVIFAGIIYLNKISMRYTNKLLTMAALLSLIFSVSCKDNGGGNNTPDPEIPGEELAGTWTAVREDAITAPAGAEAIAAEFADFTITITADATNGVRYTATHDGEPLVFPAGGPYALEGVEDSDNFETGASVTRQPDSVPMTVTLLDNGETLRLAFTISTASGDNARVTGIEGEYVFTLDKQ